MLKELFSAVKGSLKPVAKLEDGREVIHQDYKVAEDIDYILKLYEIGNFYFIEKPIYYYRIHKKGLSHDQAKVELKNQTWDIILQKALKRRNIKKLHSETSRSSLFDRLDTHNMVFLYRFDLYNHRYWYLSLN